MSRRVAFVLILVALIAAAYAAGKTSVSRGRESSSMLVDIQCPENEEFNECGSACQTNCTYTPSFCTLQCVPGCFCKPGYIRQGNNQSPCVRRAQCPCRGNESFNICGTACPDTCAVRSQSCTRQCVPDCFCKPGFIRATNRSGSLCISLSQCNNSHCDDPNSEYAECGSACPRTCDGELNPTRKPRPCPAICRPGCFCKKGFVLSINGKCVKSEVCCLAIKGIYRTCGSACLQSCANINSSSCSLPCVAGCFCPQNSVRKSNETRSPCVLKSTC